MHFHSRYNISVPSLILTLQAFDNAGRELAAIQQLLLTTLYQTIPHISNRTERNLLLQIKRNVFRNRFVNVSALAKTNKPILEMLAAYNRTLHARAVLLSENRDQIIGEIKATLDDLEHDPQFSLAVNYSCPWLLSRRRKTSQERPNELSEQDRSVYAYATKCFSKANPFYTFAAIMLPDARLSEGSAVSEIIINISVVMSLEQNCLRSSSSVSRRLLYLRSYYEETSAFCFIIPESRQVRVVRLQHNTIAAILLSYFRTIGNAPTEEHFLNYLQERLPDKNPTFAQALLDQLVDAGIVVEYLVTDFRSFGRDLMGILPEWDDYIKLLDRHHLCSTTPEGVGAFHNQLHHCEFPQTAEEPDLYYVNSYCSVNLKPYLPSIERVADQLRAVAPLLTLKSNFSGNSAVMRRYLTNRLEAEPEKQLPLLKVAADFLRQFDENVSRSQTPPRTDADGGDTDSGYPELAKLTGNISDTEMGRLVMLFTRKGIQLAGLCSNGPFDFKSEMFYPSNLFAGNSRMFARYLLGCQSLPELYRSKSSAEGVLDVQIAAPLHQNRNFVAPMFTAGCGLEGRYSHLFETWIDPSDVIIELSSEGIRYRCAKSGFFLRFHFFGLILAHYLIAPYQLLLLDHADFYENPFEWPAPSASNFYSGGSAQHIPGLYYRALCLRREQWLMCASEINRIVVQADVLLATVELRDAVHAITGLTSEYWFYKVLETGKRGSKPRFLDLCNPLSVLTLRKTLRCLTTHSVISLMEMHPSPQSGMLTDADGPISTEVMVEV